MRPSESLPDLSPSVLLDMVQRLEDAASLLWFERVNAADLEHLMALDLGRFRCLEAAAMLGTLAERLAEPRRAA